MTAQKIFPSPNYQLIFFILAVSAGTSLPTMLSSKGNVANSTIARHRESCNALGRPSAKHVQRLPLGVAPIIPQSVLVRAGEVARPGPQVELCLLSKGHYFCGRSELLLLATLLLRPLCLGERPKEGVA